MKEKKETAWAAMKRLDREFKTTLQSFRKHPMRESIESYTVHDLYHQGYLAGFSAAQKKKRKKKR